MKLVSVTLALVLGLTLAAASVEWDPSDVIPETSFDGSVDDLPTPPEELAETTSRVTFFRRRRSYNDSRRRSWRSKISNSRVMKPMHKVKAKIANPLSKRTIKKDEILPDSELANWMKDVPDEREFKEINMPGTHDTAAYTYVKNAFAGTVNSYKTQNWNLVKQMHKGLRYFDMRIKANKKHSNIQGDVQLEMYHGPVKLGLKFVDLVNDATFFLEKHGTETLVMRLKMEGCSYNCQGEDIFNQAIAQVIQTTGCKEQGDCSKYFAQGVEATTNLKALRGKIVILHSSGWTATKPVSDYGMSYDKDIKSQDMFNPAKREDKWVAIKNGFDDCRKQDKDYVYINYASAQVCGYGVTKNNICTSGREYHCRAKPISCVSEYLYEDKRLPSYFRKEGKCYSSKTNGRVGMLALDFPDKRMDLVSNIIESNVR